MTISRDAWLAAIGEAEVQQNIPGAVTMDELAAMFTCGRSAAEVRVKRLVARGLAQQVRMKRQDSSGKWRVYNAYVLVQPARKKPR